MSNCELCGKPLGEMTLTEAVEALEEYREKFPALSQIEAPAFICEDCYRGLEALG